MRSLCGDLLAAEEERMREAADTTEVYRRGRRPSLVDSGETPTPAQGKEHVDPGAFDDETATREMQASHDDDTSRDLAPDDDTSPELPDDTATQEVKTLPMGARQASAAMIDTPALGAEAVRGLAQDMRLTPRAGSPSSTPPPPAPPSGPTIKRKAPSRPRPRLDTFDNLGGDSEVFFSRSADGQRLVRKPPARTSTEPAPDKSVLVDDPPTTPGAVIAPRSQWPSSAPPPSHGAHVPAIPGPPHVPGELRLPPMMHPPSIPEATSAKLGRGLMFAGIGASIGVIAFLLIVSLAPPPRTPPGVVSAGPVATMPPTATTTQGTATVTTPPIPTLAVSALPQHPTTRPQTRPPPTTYRAPPPPPPNTGTVSAGTGYLTVMCNPACDDVLLDGSRSLGPSPLFKEAVPAGHHKLLLKRDPSVTRSVDATVTADQTTFLKPDMR
jgi:hypothetical protein